VSKRVPADRGRQVSKRGPAGKGPNDDRAPRGGSSRWFARREHQGPGPRGRRPPGKGPAKGHPWF